MKTHQIMYQVRSHYSIQAPVIVPDLQVSTLNVHFHHIVSFTRGHTHFWLTFVLWTQTADLEKYLQCEKLLGLAGGNTQKKRVNMNPTSFTCTFFAKCFSPANPSIFFHIAGWVIFNSLYIQYMHCNLWDIMIIDSAFYKLMSECW